MQINELIGRTKIDRREAELLLGHVLKKDQVFLRVHGDKPVGTLAVKKFNSLINRRLKHEPIAYLTGSQPFMGRDFMVNRHVLIPRPETEILAQLVIGRIGHVRTSKDVIVDVGTGSGCLAITLALELPKATIIASDISPRALAVAKINAKKLKANVKFIKSDLLSALDIRRLTQNVIFVANLPYLPTHDKKTMAPDVAKYEPAKALFVNGDGSVLIKKLLKQIHSSLFTLHCSIFLEIDPRQAFALKQFAKNLFPQKKVQIKKDLCGRERFLIVI